MKYNEIDFETYFKHYPDANGFFGKYGGCYIPEELKNAMMEIAEAYRTIAKDVGLIARSDFHTTYP